MADRMHKKSLFGRVVDAQTGGKFSLRHMKSSGSLLSSMGNSGDASKSASPSTSPRTPSHSTHPEVHNYKKDTTRDHSLDTQRRKRSIMTEALRAEMTHLLLEAVSKCSRQKMRFILMTLRRIGGVDGYMSYNDLSRVLQDNGLVIPSTASDMVQKTCSDQLGIDSEKVWKLLMEVHSQSDRDSVRARRSMHLRAPVITVFADPGGDRELLERMETELLSAGASEPPSMFDLNAFKTAVLALDKTRRGHVPNTQLVKTCRDLGFPVKGDLLKSLLIRCDDDNNGKVSHRELFVLLDKAMESALRVNSHLFQKKEEAPAKKQNDAGRLLKDGIVTQMSSTTMALRQGSTNALEEDNQSTIENGFAPDGSDGGGKGNTANQAGLLAVEEQGGKPKGKMSRMKGFLGRKKGGSSGTEGSTMDLNSAASDSMSIASSVFSSASRATGYNRDLTANGLAEKPVHQVVRKIGDKKLVMWPPDEYFDSVTPKVRQPRLEWVYGYSGFAHRNNIHLLNNNNSSIVYFVGYLVVIYDLNAERQQIYAEHDGPVQIFRRECETTASMRTKLSALYTACVKPATIQQTDVSLQCLAVSPDGTKIASGQSGIPNTTILPIEIARNDIWACVRIWNAENLQTLHVLKSGDTIAEGASVPAIVGSVAACCFTRDGDAVVVIDEGTAPTTPATNEKSHGQAKGKARTLSVWSVDTGYVLNQKPCTESQVICGILLLKGSEKGKDLCVMYGRNLMEAWRVVAAERRVEFVRQYVFGNIPKPPIVTCIIQTPLGHLLSADSDGNVILWNDEMRPRGIIQQGNKTPVFSLCSIASSMVLVGGRNGSITVLPIPDPASADPVAPTKDTSNVLRTRIPEQYGGVRVLLPLFDNASSSEAGNSEQQQTLPSAFVIGTTANCILHASLFVDAEANHADLQFRELEPTQMTLLTAGHFDRLGSLCNLIDNGAGAKGGLSTGSRSLGVSAGMDGNINCYDLGSHKTLWRMFLKESMVTAADCFAPFMALGTYDGKLKLFQVASPDVTQLLQANVGQGRVSCIKFAPDGRLVAVGSRDSEIYVYKISQGEVNLAFLGRFDKHDYPPISIDWSRNPARDNHYVIHSNSYQFENFLWDAENSDFLEEAHFYRNVKWTTQSCVFGFAAVTSVTWESSLEGSIVCTEVTPTLDMVAVVTSPVNQETAKTTDGAVAQQPRNVVGLYSYPNANVQVAHQQHKTPASDVVAVRFVYVNNQLCLLCAHGQDGSVTQWSLL